MVGGEKTEEDKTVMKHTIGRGVGIVPTCVLPTEISGKDHDLKCNDELTTETINYWTT